MNGLFNVELQFLFLFMRQNGVHVSELHEFMQPWTWPRSSSEPRNAFSKKRIDLTGDHYKCDAAEAMHVYRLVAIFLLTMLSGDASRALQLQIASYLALCDALDLLTSVKHGIVDHERLRHCILEHLAAFKRAYNDLGWLPKHHLSIHLADQLRMFLLLLNLLTHERKHKVIKRWSKDRFTQKSFEIGLMEELTLDHIYHLQTPWCTHGLLHRCEPRPRMLDAIKEMYPDATRIATSRGARARGGVVMAGDMAFAMMSGAPALLEVRFHVAIDENELTCVNVMEPSPADSDARAGTATFRYGERYEFIPVHVLVASTVFVRKGRMITVVVPAFLSAAS